MSTAASSPRKSRKLLWISLIVLIGGYLGLLRYLPTQWSATNRLYGRVNIRLEGKEVAVENTADLDEAIRLYSEAVGEKQHYDQMIKTGVVRNCPEQTMKADWSEVTFDLTACKLDGEGKRPIPIRFSDNPFQAEVWSVKVFRFVGPDKEVQREVTDVPVDMRVFHEVNPDGFSSVEKLDEPTVGANVFVWKGFMQYMYRGEGDVVKFSLVERR